MESHEFRYPLVPMIQAGGSVGDVELVYDEHTLGFIDPAQPLGVEIVVRAMSKEVADRTMQAHMEAVRH